MIVVTLLKAHRLMFPYRRPVHLRAMHLQRPRVSLPVALPTPPPQTQYRQNCHGVDAQQYAVALVEARRRVVDLRPDDAVALHEHLAHAERGTALRIAAV